MISVRTQFLLSLAVGALSLLFFRLNALTITLAVLLVCCLLTLKGRREWLWLLALVCLFALRFAGHQHFLSQQESRPGQKNVAVQLLIYPDDLVLTDTGRIRGQGTLSSGEKVWFSYQAKDIGDFQAWQIVRRPVLVRGRGDDRRILPATNFYQFDFQAFSQTKGISHQLILKKANLEPAQSKNLWQAVNFRFRTWHFACEQWAHHLPNPLANYALALLLGAKDQSLYSDNPKIQELGLIHLFSLSGFHVAFLSGCLAWFGKRLGLYREVTLAILVVALPSFYLLTACPPILVRAVLAGELRLFGQAFHHRISPLRVWSAALLGTLFVQPLILLTLGGQLSFALTLALTLVPTDWANWQKGLFLSVLSFPLIVAQQYTWNIWQSAANLLAVPVFGTVILPVVLSGYFIHLAPLTELTNLVVRVFDTAVAWVGSWPGKVVIGDLTWPIFLVLFVLPWFILRASRQVQQRLTMVWLIALCLGFVRVHWFQPGEYTTFDIGQGDAALLLEPGNKTATLIDTGGKVSFQRRGFLRSKAGATAVDSRTNEGQARSVIVPYLHARGLSHLQTLSLSHQDQDHIGDAHVILENFRVDKLLVPAGMRGQPAFQRKIQPYLQGTKVIEVTDNSRVKNLPLVVLHPFQPGIGENEDSIALAGRVGPLTLFTAGDLDQAGEEKIRQKYPDFRPNLVKFGHHGSKTSTKPAAFAFWQPRYGLISAGRENRYGHPNQETLETAAKNRMIVYDTRRQGMLRYVYYSSKKGYFQVNSNHDLTNVETTN
ncbi:DNA internalization-related competence protein ComEC/Rec2 [Fructobacillus pseudoficulneus]|uniref:DNA internalization-related competence protein ComEC/Rec2 n=1 Tax=Fructobacillus pseudoficulneus TaxID=220714 RepID=UPI00075195E8|nr:DNA internalization-related competence protein ComEC/Rec2 [Fructobacillus pseudoficulneus]SEH36477.1 competence protein ComEC [Fructobacillus pseudoficulneus]